jgi:predicted AlkP superfamily pyrophosphatase or phosphodiesterase
LLYVKLNKEDKMKPLSIREYTDEFKELGEPIHETDSHPDWEQNATKLFKNGTKYTLIASNGCSCWDGDWEGWTNINKTELRKLGIAWSKDWGIAEKEMGEWIKESKSL